MSDRPFSFPEGSAECPSPPPLAVAFGERKAQSPVSRRRQFVHRLPTCPWLKAHLWNATVLQASFFLSFIGVRRSGPCKMLVRFVFGVFVAAFVRSFVCLCVFFHSVSYASCRLVCASEMCLSILSQEVIHFVEVPQDRVKSRLLMCS